MAERKTEGSDSRSRLSAGALKAAVAISYDQEGAEKTEDCAALTSLRGPQKNITGITRALNVLPVENRN